MTLNEFIQPDGRLKSDWFINNDLLILLAGWISQSTTKYPPEFSLPNSLDYIQRQYVYYLAFDYLVGHLNFEPANVNVNDKGSAIRRNEQIRYFESQREMYLSAVSITDRIAFDQSYA